MLFQLIVGISFVLISTCLFMLGRQIIRHN
jgi:hypothetical protein